MNQLNQLLLGPLLGLEGEDDTHSLTRYTVCFLTDNTVTAPIVQASCGAAQINVACVKVGNPNSGIFWRANLNIPLLDTFQVWHYAISDSGKQIAPQTGTTHAFYVPGKSEKARFAFATCNGFSSAKLTQEFAGHSDTLWKAMRDEQAARQADATKPDWRPKNAEDRPLSLLVLGGDQIYADSILETERELSEWIGLSRAEQIAYLDAAHTNPEKMGKLRGALDKFYFNLYRTQWSQSLAMAEIFATVPTVMMWDDHDIFDGWGSFDDALLGCPVFKAIFAAAKKYFELFQLRGPNNQSLQNSGLAHYGLSLVFRDFSFVALDGRSHRTITHVMEEQGIKDFRKALTDYSKFSHAHTLVMVIGLPLVYRRFSESELLRIAAERGKFSDSYYDDILDHWNFKGHRAELCSITNTLLAYQAAAREAQNPQPRVLVLSGDVHVACAGTIKEVGGLGRISQVVSSGIVHPAPSWLEWFGLSKISDASPCELSLGDGKLVRLTVDHIPGASDTFIRLRNFVRINHGSDGKLWANWQTEAHILANGKPDPNVAQITLAC